MPLIRAALGVLALLAAAPSHAQTEVSSNGDGSGVTPELAEWLASLPTPGRINSNLASHVFPVMGAGFIATDDIKAEETLVEIPLDAVMSQRTAANSDVKGEAKAAKLDPFSSLVLHVMYEDNQPSSTYSAYLKTLPADIELPLTWTDEELAELAGTQFLQHTLRQRQTMTEEYSKKLEPIFMKNATKFPTARFNLPRYMWAASVVKSRSFFVSAGEGLEPVPVLVPVADVFNLHNDARTDVSMDPDTKVFRMKALQDVPKGQQVFINLGQKTNFVLLNTYGFSDPDNHHDSLSVRLQLDEADPFLAAKERMLQRFGLKNDASATVTRLADTVTVPLDLLAFIRVKFDRYLKIAEGKAVSLRNELDALRTLMLDVRAMLDSFPTSVQQDSELLRREGGLGRRLAFAAAYRRSEKVLLHSAMKRVVELWDALLLQGFEER